MRSLLVLLFAVCALAQIFPEPCSTLSYECVGEGASCNTDVQSGSTVCDRETVSLCRICGDASLVCHQNQCIKRTQGPGQPYNPANHEYCLDGLSINGNTCRDPLNVNPTAFAGFDEPCDDSSDCLSGGDLSCDPFLKKCRLQPPEPYTCDEEYDCPSGHSCSLADTTVNPAIPRQCKKAIPLGSREGALCSRPETGAEEDNLECGYLYSCQQLNPNEFDARFIRRVCVAPFSLGPGRLCSSGYFCASGKCYNGFCADYDPGTYGLGCGDNADCGRFLQCACPVEGGGRERCVADSEIRGLNLNRQEYNRQKGYLACLEEHGCQYLHAELGTCGWKNCRSKLTGLTYNVNFQGDLYSDSGVYTITVSRALETPALKCEVYHSPYPEYEGYEVVVSAATGSFRLSLIPLLLAFFALFGLH